MQPIALCRKIGELYAKKLPQSRHAKVKRAA